MTSQGNHDNYYLLSIIFFFYYWRLSPYTKFEVFST